MIILLLISNEKFIANLFATKKFVADINCFLFKNKNNLLKM
jgi:hypothetical protein